MKASDLTDLRRCALEQYGLTFGGSYQQIYQWASATVPTAKYDTALGSWAAPGTTWTPLDRGGDYEGTLVVRGAFRGRLGGNAELVARRDSMSKNGVATPRIWYSKMGLVDDKRMQGKGWD